MIWNRFLLSLGIVLVTALTLACGGGDGRSKALLSVSPDDLAMMVLDQDELGEEFAHLEADADSGLSDNEDAAANSIDPDDTAEDLAQFGRVGGYTLAYMDPHLAALDVGEGVISLSQELDLFQDSDGASRFFSKQMDDFRRMEGALLDNGVGLEQVETFPADGLAEEAMGLRVRASHEGVEFYQTVVAFRLDRLVAATVLFRADNADANSQVQGIASDLARRIEEMSLGTALVAQPGEVTSDGTERQRSEGTFDSDLAGEWRVYSETLFYDAGGSGGSDSGASTTRMLTLKDAGTWEFGSSRGTWYVTSIESLDWDRWGTASYGPERKIVLEGWNGDVGDGPVEESAGGVDFFWVIYHVDDPDPGTVQLKFGHP